MANSNVTFTRFADDYHIFAHSREEAYQHLVYLSEKLFINQGLSLQKSKTRIMSAAEFKATSSLKKDAEAAHGEGDEVSAQNTDANRLLRFSLKFDPYSPTKEEDYQQLQAEIRKFDVIGMLRSELGKSRIHTALARKIVATIKYLDEGVRDEAVQSILKNSDLLYPIFSSVLLMLAQLYDGLSPGTRADISAELRKLIRLRRFFLSRGKRVATRPLFKGCGYVDESEGDVLSGDAVYEIKSVDRPFRSIDIHQLLTYAALNSMSAQFSVTKLGAFNPRRGIFFELELDEISREISGRAATELLWTIANSISSGEISR